MLFRWPTLPYQASLSSLNLFKSFSIQFQMVRHSCQLFKNKLLGDGSQVQPTTWFDYSSAVYYVKNGKIPQSVFLFTNRADLKLITNRTVSGEKAWVYLFNKGDSSRGSLHSPVNTFDSGTQGPPTTQTRQQERLQPTTLALWSPLTKLC